MPRVIIRRVVSLGCVLVLLATVGPAYAWRQLKPPGDWNSAVPCENTADSPCIEWRKTSSDMSIYADVFMTDFLGDEEVDLETDVRNTFSKWNAAPARNPILRATTSTDGDEIFVTTELMNYDIYGYTTDTYGAAPDYHITHAVIKFNTKIIWNRNYDYGCSQISPLMCAADARKVTMHEMGHAEGLGHQPASPDWNAAVMKQGALTYWTPRPDDLSGLTHIYGAYP